MDNYYANGMDERLIGICKINGIQYDSVGVKYKGNSTYNANNAKNPMNIKLDHVLNQDYQGYETIKLSNGRNDPSFVREVLSYEIVRKYMDAPLSNYAEVYINGNYHGLYSSSESINGSFGERYLFADANNTRFKCNPVSNFGNNGSSLEYLGTDSSIYYDSYELKSALGWQDMIDLTNTISNNPGGIESMLDMDRTLWMLAFNNVTVNLDSYTGLLRQNYYLIKDNNDIFNPIIWDLNEGLGGFEAVFPGPPNTSDMTNMDPQVRLNDPEWPLLNLVYSNNTYNKMYITHCKTILEENFLNGWYLARADSLQVLIDSSVVNDPNAMYSYSDFQNNITVSTGGGPGAVGIEELMGARITYLESNQFYINTAPTISGITNSPSVPSANSSFTVTANIQNASYAFVAYQTSSADEFQAVEMFDDGLHNDGNSGDSTYGAVIFIGPSEVQYYIYGENSNAGIFSPERAAHEYYSISLVGDLVINEIQASNSTTVPDDNNEYDDWIELYNNTSSSISLNGYYLSDNSGNPTKWPIPNVVIAANDFFTIWADNDSNQTGIHANFKLSAAGEALLLTGPSLNIIDEIVYGAQQTDDSFGRYPNGTGSFTGLYPTYGAENSLTLNILERSSLSGIRIFPNPATSIVYLVFEESSIPEKISLYNIMGELIYEGLCEAQLEISLANYCKGLYVLRTSDGRTEKLILH